MRKAAFDEFVAQGVALRIVHEREGMSVTSGRALWRSRLPETRFVLATRDRCGGTQNTVTFFGRARRNCQPSGAVGQRFFTTAVARARATPRVWLSHSLSCEPSSA